MILRKISILNFRNLAQAELELSPKINCLIGKNGMGKTNLLDAIYYLSFCKSCANVADSQNILHDQKFFVIQGFYAQEDGTSEEIYCGMKLRQKKQFKRNKKEYVRFSDHIGLIPLIMVSPADSDLIAGERAERRRFMDVLISQYDKTYLEALIRYNKAMEQRNALLKKEEEPDGELMLIWEEAMAKEGEIVYAKRRAFVEEFIPIFQDFYAYISQEQEQVSLAYESQLASQPLLDALRESRQRDRIMGYTLVGIHRDDLVMKLGNYPIKREGSQGQNKTYLVALKLAQFDLLKRTGNQTTPLLLLDDIFDKLDSQRVEQIVKLVAGDRFGQIFITDTNSANIDKLLQKSDLCHHLYRVEQGEITLLSKGEREDEKE